MQRVKLSYIGRLVKGDSTSPRMWNVIEPRLPGYRYHAMHYPTLGVESLKEMGLI